MVPPTVYPLSSLSPQLSASLKEETDRSLQSIIKANITSRYASSSSDLADFRLAIASKGVEVDSILSDFRRLVPLTDYEAYRSLIAKFLERPCQLSEVENLLAPGLPSYVAVSSSTSGNKPKHFVRYVEPDTEFGRVVRTEMASGGTTAIIYTTSYKSIVEVTTSSGEVVKRIPVCTGSGGYLRTTRGWPVETDDTRMAARIPGTTTPWGAALIHHYRSFLIIHGLFALADPSVERISMSFVTFFMDLVGYIQGEWDMLLTSIRDGVIPNIDHIEHLRDALQVNMRADPQRAEELRKIGPPFSCPAWASRVWPKLKALLCVCSGTFATSLPMARSVIGPNVVIMSPGYACTECPIGGSLNPGDPETFVVGTKDVVEYLNVEDNEAHDNIRQAWDLQPGRLYQPVVTTWNGLWRYIIDDVLHVIGFHPDNGSPVFKYHGRTSLAIRFHHGTITEADLVKVTQAFTGEDVLPVKEFTSVHDRRKLPETVGFIVELTGDMGPSASSAMQRAFEALFATNVSHQREFNAGGLGQPTIRIVKPGTFANYRRWQGEKLNTGIGQVKVPVLMVDPASLEWLEERVVNEY